MPTSSYSAPEEHHPHSSDTSKSRIFVSLPFRTPIRLPHSPSKSTRQGDTINELTVGSRNELVRVQRSLALLHNVKLISQAARLCIESFDQVWKPSPTSTQTHSELELLVSRRKDWLSLPANQSMPLAEGRFATFITVIGACT